MKKILSILASACLMTATAAATVSCARPNGLDISIADDSSIAPTYRHSLNYQTGPDTSATDLNKNGGNDYLTSINVNAESTYSAYNIGSGKNGWKSPSFYGDKDQLLKTSDNNFSTSGWLNDTIMYQNILGFKQDVKKYTNIKLSIDDKTTDKNGKIISDDKKLTGEIKFEKYMLTNKHNTASIEDTLPDFRQFVPDAVGTSEMDSLSQQVSVDNGDTYSSVYFDIWNAWINLHSTDKTMVGKHNMQIAISFDYDGQKMLLKKDSTVSIKNYVFSNAEVDENKDGKITDADKFGLSASTFPNNGLAQWNNDIYTKDVSNYNVAAKIGTKQFSWNLDKSLKSDEITINKEFVTYGSDISMALGKDQEGNDSITFTPSDTTNNFDAFVTIKDSKTGKLISTISVYYNLYGEPTYAFIYNSENDAIKDGSGNEIKDPSKVIDINGDGTKNSKDWDIDGDGKYTREDYNAAGNTSSKFNGDEIGPDQNYGDWIRRTPLAWNDLNKEIKPLGDTKTLFMSGTGSHKQLIQYTGRLIDPKLSSKFNGSSSGPADDYESALADANKSASNFAKFMSSDKKPSSGSNSYRHWEWSFDFTNLDLYMRTAAANNISQLLINPVDVGGFSFWYLKGADAKLGPQRDMIQSSALSLINTSTGKLSSTGRTYVNNVIAPLSKALSKHLSQDVYGNKIYTTASGETVKVYFSFDEDNEETIDDTMNVVHQNATYENGYIYSSCFLGWRSNISNVAFDSDVLNDDLKDEYMDQIVFVYRVITKGARNSDLVSIRQKVTARAQRGQTTLFYATYDAYPGGYSASDLSGGYWQLFFGYRLGMNGYVRWAYDDIFSDYYDTSTIDWNQHLPHASGQSFVIYGGSDSTGVHYSTRLYSYINAVNYIYKIKHILHDDNFTFSERNEVAKGLNSIGFTSIKYSNNDYKYNLKNKVNPDDFKMIMDQNTTTISEQVYKLTLLINSL